MSDETTANAQRHAALSAMPVDELRRYAMELGLDLPAAADKPQLLDAVRAQQELLLELDRDALLDVVIWGRRPVRRSASKEELACQIARLSRTNYDSLSSRGLVVLCRLRGLPALPADSAHDLIDRLRKHDGIWVTLRRKRRAVVGSLLTRLFEKSESAAPDGDYKFLPEDDGAAAADRRSLKDHVAEHGLVGGIAQRLRGAADDYIKVKLDEIEARIDTKLDAIDKRLGEWRDREVRNRLKILRITLMFTVLVALLSLGYSYLKHWMTAGP